jgi:hypothetical protein
MSVLFSSDLEGDHTIWTELDFNEASDLFYMKVDPTMCHIVTSKLGSYVLVANLTDLNQVSIL